SEGGSIDAEWYFRNAVDRTSTMAEAWMGLTAGCAVCHDHKYDPLSKEEFYSLYAFFYSVAGPPLDGNALLHDPFMKVPSAEQSAKLADVDRRIGDARHVIAREIQSLTYVDPDDAVNPPTGAASGGAPVAGGKAPADPSRSFRAWLGQGGGPQA